MNKFGVLFVGVLAILLFCDIAAAASPNLVVEKNPLTKKDILKWEFLPNYTLGTGTGYTASDSGGTSTATGWIPVHGLKDKTIGYAVTNTDAGTYTVRVEGLVGTSSTNAIFKIVDVVFNGTTTGSIAVVEPLSEMKVSVNKTGTGTGRVNLWGELYVP